MSRSQALYHLQQLDTGLDNAHKRVQEIDTLLQDRSALALALQNQQRMKDIHEEKVKILKSAEHEVSLQNTKVEQNQKKLYSGAVTNPKELEDLQLEAASLQKYLGVLEERQLEAMLEADQALTDLAAATADLEGIQMARDREHKALIEERTNLESSIASLSQEKNHYLEEHALSDLSIYQSLRESSGGIAVTLMVDSSCSSCGANIPSAIDQEAKSPTKLAFCPTCKRILHPGT